MVRVVKPQPVYVDKEVYNILRSFVESSIKDRYQFNIGVCVDNIAVFKKSKWKLIIMPKKVVLHDGRVSVHVIFDSVYEIDINGQRIRTHENKLKMYNIVPDTEVPYMKPILLYNVISKALVYYEAGQDCW